MREYGYLSKYSQQSHEAVNAMMTLFFSQDSAWWICFCISRKKRTQATGTLVSVLVDVVVWDRSQGF
jgi:hypothetical protein